MQDYVLIIVAIALLACVGYLVEKKENKTKEKKKKQEAIIENKEMSAPLVGTSIVEEPLVEPIVTEEVISAEQSNETAEPEAAPMEVENVVEENVENPIIEETTDEAIVENQFDSFEPQIEVSETEIGPEIKPEESQEEVSEVVEPNVEEIQNEEIPFEPIDEQFNEISEIETFGPIEESENMIEEVTVEDFPVVENEVQDTLPEENNGETSEVEIESQFPTQEEQEESLEEIRNIFETTIDAPIPSELTDGTGELILDNDTSIDHDFETLLTDESIEEMKEEIPEVKETKKEDFRVLDDDDEDLWKF